MTATPCTHEGDCQLCRLESLTGADLHTEPPRWNPTALLTFLRAWGFDVSSNEHKPDEDVRVDGAWVEQPLLEVSGFHYDDTDNVHLSIRWNTPPVVDRALRKPGFEFPTIADIQIPREAAERAAVWPALLQHRLTAAVAMKAEIEAALSKRDEICNATIAKASKPFAEVFMPLDEPPGCVVGWFAESDDSSQLHLRVEFRVNELGTYWYLGASGSLEDGRDVQAILAAFKEQGGGWWTRWLSAGDSSLLKPVG